MPGKPRPKGRARYDQIDIERRLIAGQSPAEIIADVGCSASFVSRIAQNVKARGYQVADNRTRAQQKAGEWTAPTSPEEPPILDVAERLEEAVHLVLSAIIEQARVAADPDFIRERPLEANELAQGSFQRLERILAAIRPAPESQIGALVSGADVPALPGVVEAEFSDGGE